jgi:SH3-like domain-containing protein
MQIAHSKFHVLRQYQPQYAQPLEVAAGDKLIVGREDDEFPGWKWCRAANGREGWVPKELLSQQDTEAIALENYSSRELAVESGEEVELEQERHEWLLVRNASGARGWIPASHVLRLEQ